MHLHLSEKKTEASGLSATKIAICGAAGAIALPIVAAIGLSHGEVLNKMWEQLSPSVDAAASLPVDQDK